MNRSKQKNQTAARRKNRTRAKVRTLGNRPRLSVFRSNKEVYAQIIDDKTGTTIASVSTKGISAKAAEGMTAGVAKAFEAGKQLAKKAVEKNVSEVVFDRGQYAFHGKVKAIADGAKEAGLKI